MIGVTVTNSGAVSADEVVQCYVGDQMASVARPERQLVGFARVPLEAGTSKRVTFTIHPSRLAFHDDDFHFVCEPGAFRVEIGGWAGNPAITETFDLEGDIEDHRQRDVVATVVTVEPIAPSHPSRPSRPEPWFSGRRVVPPGDLPSRACSYD